VRIAAFFFSVVSRPVATGEGAFGDSAPPIFVVARKMYFEHITKTNTLSPKNVFCPPNLATGLVISAFYKR